MTIHENYNHLIKPEIEALKDEVESALSKVGPVADYLKGWRVFFSPLLEKPKVLFIGINPGAGEEGDDLEDDKDRLEYLQYFDYEAEAYREATYSLARETKAVFRSAGLFEALEKSAVKTNFFFLSTTTEKEVYKITDFLGRSKHHELLGDKVFAKAADWTRRLIELIEPEIIICEGKSTYNNVTDLALFQEYGEWQNWDNGLAYTTVLKQNLIIIGYSRRFSSIRNKEGLAKLLQQFLKR